MKEVSLSLKRLREIERERFNEGVEACRAEREYEMCLASQGLSESGFYEHEAEIQRGE